MLDRRTLLTRALGMGGALWVAQSMREQPVRAATPTAWKLSPRQVATLDALQDRLLPSAPDAPGARTVHATPYLLSAAADASVTASERKDIARGLDRLEAHAIKNSAKGYAQLVDAEKDAVLGSFQSTDGAEPFMALVLVYTLEALLGDPVYGVNPDGVGWKWLHHDPGFPRPTTPWKGTP